MDAQGFKGLPRIVDADEFDEYVRESNFIAQRTYSAPDQETLDAYQDALYNGEWYVDCSTGGSAYGQGMYCAGNYEGKLTNEIKQEMKDYMEVNENYVGKEYVANIETMTLDKSAKIADYDTIFNEFGEWKSDAEARAKREIIEKMEVNDNIKAVLRGQTGSLKDDEDFYGVFKIYSELSDEDKIFIQSQIKGLNEMGLKAGMEIAEYNVGSYAALKGYDAIRTTHGTSGADTVILNRTKLIIKKG